MVVSFSKDNYIIAQFSFFCYNSGMNSNSFSTEDIRDFYYQEKAKDNFDYPSVLIEAKMDTMADLAGFAGKDFYFANTDTMGKVTKKGLTPSETEELKRYGPWAVAVSERFRKAEHSFDLTSNDWEMFCKNGVIFNFMEQKVTFYSLENSRKMVEQLGKSAQAGKIKAPELVAFKEVLKKQQEQLSRLSKKNYNSVVVLAPTRFLKEMSGSKQVGYELQEQYLRKIKWEEHEVK